MNVNERPVDVCVVPLDEARAWADLLDEQMGLLRTTGMRNRPWMYWEWHNPWSRAATSIDSWQLLDICQAPGMVGCLAEFIGKDIVLFDSQVLPNPALAIETPGEWQDSGVFFPLNEPGGVVVRVPFGGTGPQVIEFRGPESRTIEYTAGEILVHAADLAYRIPAQASAPGFDYVIRYFPASLRYLRDADHPSHVRLTNQYPWINYRTMPLWLVSGKDRADNDFVTGFFKKVGRWTTAQSAS